ncbi:MAG: DUF5698 domain-containing protein [Firmicutes bacterium]|nr:DUF5698 domain-containing protein [Bacillota bacterium]
MILFLNMLFIFFARVTDVTLSTVRILMIMRGRSVNAAMIGFFEVTLYILALSKVIDSLDNPVLLVTYALGFAAGTFTGGYVEERLAVGFATAQIISLQEPDLLATELRAQGFGVTILEGCGREGNRRQILHVLLKRKDMPCLLRIVEKNDKDAFVTVMDTRKILGGYFTKIKAK